MVQSCSAYGCKNRYDKDKPVSFHKRKIFQSPKNSFPDLRQHPRFPRLMLLSGYSCLLFRPLITSPFSVTTTTLWRTPCTRGRGFTSSNSK
ncbi:THAP domain-containing protein 1 isoform X3 [Delphinus delphis]|uniref:THAP domain-containing protein 1 isoform X3 n=1 Tax=Delphinus delphis TaxID=9728 RepID=UPI003750A2D8